MKDTMVKGTIKLQDLVNQEAASLKTVQDLVDLTLGRAVRLHLLGRPFGHAVRVSQVQDEFLVSDGPAENPNNPALPVAFGEAGFDFTRYRK